MRALLLAVAFLPAMTVLAEDLRSSDGTVYRQTKIVRADPDGLIVEYEKGIAKIDFEKLPPEIQRQFGFSTQKAAAYRAQETQVVQENQRIVKEHQEHELERIRKMMESGAASDELIYHAGPGQGTAARIVRQIEREMEAKQEAALAAERAPQTFWTLPFWRILGGHGGSGSGGSGGGGEGPFNNGAGFDNHRGFSN